MRAEKIHYFRSMHPIITSFQNSKVKQALGLEKSRERKKQQRFLLEGFRELGLALKGGFIPTTVFFDPEQIDVPTLKDAGLNEQVLIPVQQNVFAKMAVRAETAQVVAVMPVRDNILQNLKLSEKPLILVVESVEKPGNLGALLRTADAAGLDAVIVCDPLVDFYNPNVIRSSVGTVFTCPVAAASSAETIAWLKNKGIKIYCTHLVAAKPYTLIDFTQPAAIVMGTEATGLSDQWPEQSDENIIIPMRGMIDSMNVSAAAAVVVFEAVRQRFHD